MSFVVKRAGNFLKIVNKDKIGIYNLQHIVNVEIEDFRDKRHLFIYSVYNRYSNLGEVESPDFVSCRIIDEIEDWNPIILPTTVYNKKL